MPGDHRGMKDVHARSMESIRQIRERLRVNDNRLSRLEGGNGTRSATWEKTVEDSDLLIAAVAAIDLSAIMQTHDPEAYAQIHRVLERFPGMTEESLMRNVDLGGHHKIGAISQIQGYLGEELAVNAINHGAIPVPLGYHAVMAGSTNEAAYDLTLVDDHGHQLAAQVKISETGAVVREHLRLHPDVRIVYTNTEAAQQLANDHGVSVIHPGDHFPDHAHTVVVDMGITRDHVRQQVTDFVNHVDHADHVGVLHKFAEELPLISLVVIAGTAVKQYATTDDPGAEIFGKAKRRLIDVMTASGIAMGAQAVGAGEISAALRSVYLLGLNGFRVARANVAQSTATVHSVRTVLATF